MLSECCERMTREQFSHQLHFLAYLCLRLRLPWSFGFFIHVPLTYKAPTPGSTRASIPDFFRFLFSSDSLRGILLSSPIWLYFKFASILLYVRRALDSDSIFRANSLALCKSSRLGCFLTSSIYSSHSSAETTFLFMNT